MRQAPQLFESYHEGFRQQTRDWPVQPVDVAASWLSGLPSDLVVADFGCGDAKLMRTVKQKVLSFDLVANAPGVTACNMADLPLADASVDVSVFSLALMGTDYGAFLEEAARVTRRGGWLWIAEVRSRFGGGGVEKKEDFRPFLSCLAQLGFRLTKQDASNRMFVTWILKKDSDIGQKGGLRWPKLKACVYKRR